MAATIDITLVREATNEDAALQPFSLQQTVLSTKATFLSSQFAAQLRSTLL